MDPGEFPNEADNTSNGNHKCYMFNAKQLEEITIMTVSLAVVGFLMCLVALIVIMVLKQYRSFVHRLITYLLLVGIIQEAAIGMQVIPIDLSGNIVKIKEGLHDLCVAVGFFSQVVASIFYLLVAWVILYLALLTVFKYRANKRKHEITGLLITFGIPPTFSWLPFTHNAYGLAGPTCWIRSTDVDNCDLNTLGVIYQFSLFYGPLMVLILFGFLSFLAIVVTLCIRNWRHPQEEGTHQQQTYQQAIKESLLFLVYPVLYILIASVMLTNRIYYVVTTANGEKPFYPLWYAHVTVDPLRVLFVPVAFLLHPGTI